MESEKRTSEAWERLLSLALASLDDHDAERLERCRQVARKKLARRGLSEPPVDREAVKRFLLLYAGLKKRHGECLAESGIDVGMLLTAYDLWPEAKFVRDYVARLREEARAMRNEDRLDRALESLDRLNTEEGCELNAKSVMFTVSSLDRKTFGEERKGVGGGRPQVTYVLPNLTVNNFMSPEEAAARRAREAGAAVDVVPEAAVAGLLKGGGADVA